MDQSKLQLLVVLCLSGQMFSQNFPFHFGDRHPTPHCSVPRTKPNHHPKWYLDWFSRFCMGPKCYAVQFIVTGEENSEIIPSSLGFCHQQQMSLFIKSIFREDSWRKRYPILSEYDTLR